MANLLHISKTILVTKPGEKGVALCHLLKNQGFNAIFFPTIAFIPPHDISAWTNLMPTLPTQDWLVFVSPYAVTVSKAHLIPLLKTKTVKPKMIAMGMGTKMSLEETGLSVTLYPEKGGTDALLALPLLQHIAGQKIAIVRGEGGRTLLAETLIQRGAIVTHAIAYQRTLMKNNHRLNHTPSIDSIDCTVATSYEGIAYLKNRLQEEEWTNLQRLPLVVISERIKKLARDLGFKTIWVSSNPSNDAILTTILLTMREKNGR